MARGRGRKRGTGRGGARPAKGEKAEVNEVEAAGEEDGDGQEVATLPLNSFVCSKCKFSFATNALATNHVTRVHYGLVGINLNLRWGWT